MNKKSNIIVGITLVAVVSLIVGGMMVLSPSGKGNAQPAAVQASQKAFSAPQKIAEIEKSKETASSTEKSGSFVASRQGKKYFPVDCGSAKTIKEENRVYFGSEVEAQAAGYERTLSCK